MRLDNLFLTYDDVYNSIMGLKSINTAGPDDIPPVFLKSCAFSLTFPLTSLFNMSLQTGCFPDVWKKSFVIPLHKSGDASDVKNYRPISKLSTIAQIFDSLVHSKLTSFFSPYIGAEQHGFAKGKSTNTNLISFTEKVAESFSNRSQVDTIYTDFAKAFDRVSFEALIYKLRCSGIGGVLLQWMQSYLMGRLQVVSLGNTYSREFSVLSGVPQGSHLGPLFFSLFLNDLRSYINPRIQFLLFADDCKLFMEIFTIEDCLCLQSGLDDFVKYCELFCLRVNLEKCAVISFSRLVNGRIDFDYAIHNTTLYRVLEVKDLGVMLDSRLCFKTHLSYIGNKAMKMLGYVIRTCRDFSNLAAIKAVYSAYVRSHLEYCCQVWNTATATDRLSLERVQRKFTRFLFGKGLLNVPEISEFHYRPVLDALRLQSLECRRDKFDVKLLLQVLYFGLGNLSLDRYFRPRDSVRSFRSHRAYTTLINCPSTLNQCVRFFNEISFDWGIVSTHSYSAAMRVALEKIPLYR